MMLIYDCCRSHLAQERLAFEAKEKSLAKIVSSSEGEIRQLRDHAAAQKDEIAALKSA